MTCDACTRAEQKPTSGRYNALCDGCAARALALSPDFHESRQQRRRTERYSKALAGLFKDREEEGHALVLEWHKKLREAARHAEGAR